MLIIELMALVAAVVGTTHGLHRPVVSPDGRTAAFIRELAQPSDDTDPVPTEVVLVDISTGKRRIVLRPGKVAGSGYEFDAAVRLTFSPDSKRLYVEANCPCTSDQIYEVDLRTGEPRFLASGIEVSVLRNGPWRGNLLMGVHTCHADRPGCDYPVHVVKPDGKTVFVVPGTRGADREQVLARWLKVRRWRAS